MKRYRTLWLTSRYNEILVLWELGLVCVGVEAKCTMYQRKVDVDMLNAVKSVLADVSRPSSEQRANARNVSQHTLYGIQHIHINLTLTHCKINLNVVNSSKYVSHLWRVRHARWAVCRQWIIKSGSHVRRISCISTRKSTCAQAQAQVYTVSFEVMYESFG